MFQRGYHDDLETTPVQPAPAEAPRSTSPRPLVLAVMVAALFGGLAGAGTGFLAGRQSADSSSSPAPAATATLQAPTTQVRVEQTSAVGDAVQKVMPAMVVLEVQGPERRDNQGRLVQSTSVGSGVIIDTRGYIITNAHVIEGGQLITATLNDGRQLPGVVVDNDLPYTDLAIVKIQEGSLVAAQLGDSDALRPGDPVASLGTPVITADLPRAFEDSVTVGVVSGVHRRWVRDGVVQDDLIQTDSALNHGNSGGALINLAGQVVGITSTVVRTAETGESVEGIGFAISSNTVRKVSDAVLSGGSAARPDLGVQVTQVTPDIAATNNLSVQQGAYVQEVLPSTPAADAGIRAGDVIVKINDTQVTLDNPFVNVLGQFKPGDRVTVTVNRQGQEVTLDVVLAQQ